jgi:hypothetical protein
MKKNVPDKPGYKIVFRHLREILQLQRKYVEVLVNQDDCIYMQFPKKNEDIFFAALQIRLKGVHLNIALLHEPGYIEKHLAPSLHYFYDEMTTSLVFKKTPGPQVLKDVEILLSEALKSAVIKHTNVR